MSYDTRRSDQAVFNFQIENLANVTFCVKLLNCKNNELVMHTSMIINLTLHQLCLKLTVHNKKVNEQCVTFIISYAALYVYFGD